MQIVFSILGLCPNMMLCLCYMQYSIPRVSSCKSLWPTACSVHITHFFFSSFTSSLGMTPLIVTRFSRPIWRWRRHRRLARRIAWRNLDQTSFVPIKGQRKSHSRVRSCTPFARSQNRSFCRSLSDRRRRCPQFRSVPIGVQVLLRYLSTTHFICVRWQARLRVCSLWSRIRRMCCTVVVLWQSGRIVLRLHSGWRICRSGCSRARLRWLRYWRRWYSRWRDGHRWW